MEMTTTFQKTDAGEIPVDWVVAPLISITPPGARNGIVDGPFGSNLKTIHYRTSGVPIITSGYVTDGRFFADEYLFVDRSKFLEEKRSAVEPGDIVMAKIGERCGASAILPRDHETGILSGNALKITVDDKRHSTAFVWQVLWRLHTSGGMKLLRTIGAQPALSMASLKKHKIALPPTKSEQEAIANALSDSDALIESLEQLLAKKRNIKQGAMQELLTGKKRLPGFSGTWMKRSLLELADGKKELFDDGDWIESEHITSEGIRFIQTGNIGIGCFADRNEKKFISNTSFTSLKCKLVIPGDLLICRLADPAGRACVLPDIGEQKIVTSVDVTIFRPSATMANRVFLANLFSTKTWFSMIRDRSGGTTHKRIARGALGKLAVRMPDIEEQTAIATILSDMDADIAALEEKLAKVRNIKQGMMQQLLTGKIRLV